MRFAAPRPFIRFRRPWPLKHIAQRRGAARAVGPVASSLRSGRRPSGRSALSLKLGLPSARRRLGSGLPPCAIAFVSLPSRSRSPGATASIRRAVSRARAAAAARAVPEADGLASGERTNLRRPCLNRRRRPGRSDRCAPRRHPPRARCRRRPRARLRLRSGEEASRAIPRRTAGAPPGAPGRRARSSEMGDRGAGGSPTILNRPRPCGRGSSCGRRRGRGPR